MIAPKAHDAVTPTLKANTDPDPVVFHRSVDVNAKAYGHKQKICASFKANGKAWYLEFISRFGHNWDNSNDPVMLLALQPKDGVWVNVDYDLFVRAEATGPDLLRRRVGSGDKPPRTLVISGKDASRLNLSQGTKVFGVIVHASEEQKCEQEITVPSTSSTTGVYLHQGVDDALSLLRVPLPGFSNLFGDAKTADFTFIVEGHDIPAHAIALHTNAAGPYFNNITTLPFKESVERKVEMQDIKKDVFKWILQFIYTGRAVMERDEKDTALNLLDDLVDLYRAADRFQIPAFLPYIRAEIFFNVHTMRHPNNILQLVRRVKDIPDLSESIPQCVRLLSQMWPTVVECEIWKEVAEDPTCLRVLLDVKMRLGEL